MTPLTVSVETRELETVVAVVGELDASTCNLVEDALRAYFVGDLGRSLVVDLSGVTFFDSTGLQVLIMASREAVLNAVDFRVAGAEGQVAHVIALTGLWDVLNVDGEPPS